MNPPGQLAANTVRSIVVALREMHLHGTSNSIEKQYKSEQDAPRPKLPATSYGALWDDPIAADQNRLETCLWERGTTMQQVYLLDNVLP